MHIFDSVDVLPRINDHSENNNKKVLEKFDEDFHPVVSVVLPCFQFETIIGSSFINAILYPQNG